MIDQLSRLSMTEMGSDSITWSSAFIAATKEVPFAVVLCDMKVPGLPLTHVNKAFETLTGYTQAEAVGRNCRFLQGPDTEQDRVGAIIRALQTGEPLEVQLTNYRKNGLSFQNLLSVKPVHDSTGEYRYMIGVQSDAETLDDAGIQQFRKMSKALPSTFLESLQPLPIPQAAAQVPKQLKESQHAAAMVEFSKMVWLSDGATSLVKLLDRQDFRQGYMKFLKAEYSESQLEFVLAARELESQPADMQEQNAGYVFDEHLSAAGVKRKPGSVAAQVKDEATSTMNILAQDSFPRFVRSQQCEAVVKAVVSEGSGMSAVSRQDLVWSGYEIPEDAAEWITAFVGAAETYPACIVISDMSITGNPMIFVNQEFCRTTKYQKHEVQGRNCRFLQGPLTEPASVAVIQDTLRRGVDCHVRISNYRKNGETFLNLLSMRPVHDSNGVYRYCIGVQFEVQRNDKLKGRLKKLDALLQLLPAQLDVGGVKAVGMAHEIQPVAENVGKSTEDLLYAAYASTASVSGTDILNAERFKHNRQNLLNDISTAPFLESVRELNLTSKKGSSTTNWVDMFKQAVEEVPFAVVLSDMKVPGLPLTHVNKAFETLTGYTQAEAVGRNCRFLQGKDTEQDRVGAIIRALQTGEPLEVQLTNYRKGGQPFQNLLKLKPVHDSTGEYRYMIGVQVDTETIDVEGIRQFQQLIRTLPSFLEA